MIEDFEVKRQEKMNSFNIEVKPENRGGRIYSSDEVLIREKNDRLDELEKLKCARKISENVDILNKKCMVYDDQFRENVEKDEDFDEMTFKDLLSRPVHVAKRIAATQKCSDVKDEKGRIQ
jgi:hypothetical protein